MECRSSDALEMNFWPQSSQMICLSFFFCSSFSRATGHALMCCRSDAVETKPQPQSS